jgi:menaquinol-cytochrome c reductase iron-sulfur subunit
MMPDERTHPEGETPAAPGRREFMVKAAAVCCGGLVAAVPTAAGVAVFLDPLRNSAAEGGFVRIAPESTVPADGTPVSVAVIADRLDMWNRFPAEPIGAVYIRRGEGDKLVVFNATCPHAGCFIGYNGEARQFRCPCHTSAFELDGTMIRPSPSPRGMDSLEYEIRDADGSPEIWVKFQNFQTGKPEKIAR